VKTSKDPRHIKRVELMQTLFTWQFNPLKKPKTILEIIKNIDKLDALIQKGAPSRPVANINKIDLAILRLAVYELLFQNNAPPKVIIDEAIEMGKEYGSDSSQSFINGVLGKIVTDFSGVDF
jgi:N utilization substance protein B